MGRKENILQGQGGGCSKEKLCYLRRCCVSSCATGYHPKLPKVSLPEHSRLFFHRWVLLMHPSSHHLRKLDSITDALEKLVQAGEEMLKVRPVLGHWLISHPGTLSASLWGERGGIHSLRDELRPLKIWSHMETCKGKGRARPVVLSLKISKCVPLQQHGMYPCKISLKQF